MGRASFVAMVVPARGTHTVFGFVGDVERAFDLFSLALMLLIGPRDAVPVPPSVATPCVVVVCLVVYCSWHPQAVQEEFAALMVDRGDPAGGEGVTLSPNQAAAEAVKRVTERQRKKNKSARVCCRLPGSS